MAQYVIEILDGDRAGEVVPLPERALRIGRKPANDIVISDEKTSGTHAEIVPDNGRFVLRDLESTNGTLMDGRRVTEVVLSSGDTFVVGRVRMCFRGEQDAARVDDSALMMQTIDRSRLGRGKGSRSVALMLVLLVAALAVGGYLWWQRRADDGGGGAKIAAVLQQPGNKLATATASCESEDGWNLRLAGGGFQLGSRGSTGKAALEAVRTDSDADFALARSREALTVVSGRALSLSAFVRTTGEAKAAVRLRFFASDDRLPVDYRSGTALLSSSDGYTKVSCTAAVPAGADRVDVELLASLPQAGDSAWFDDVGITDGAEPATFDLQIDSGSRLLGGAGHVSVQSGAPVLLAVEPAVAGPLASLQKEHLLTVGDLGGSFQAEKLEHGFAIEAVGAEALWLVLPADSSNGVLAAGADGNFAGVAAESKFSAQQLLLGAGPSRCLLSLPAAVELEGQIAGGLYRLHLPGNRFELLLQFRSERNRANALLTDARRSQEAEPGKALGLLRELVRTLPHDDRVLAEARTLRAEISGRMEKQLTRLRGEFEEAGFFKTRGGFERVVNGIDDLVASFGEANLEDAAAVLQLRADAAAQLQELDRSRAADRLARLEALADGLQQQKQAELEKLVRDYLKQQ